MSLDISMKDLLESGVHFGHRTNRWDPRMKPYIFTERNGIHIIDLQQTVQSLEKGYTIIRDKVAEGGTILFVGTKRQAQETVQLESERCGMPYVVERWLPGTLTNWITIHQRIMELERLEKMRDSGEIDRLVKKEGLMIEREINRLLIHLSGIRHMNGLPDLLFVVDVMREITAVHEANLKGVPIVAMVDTNCDPTNIDYIIPANDDAIRAIKLMVAKIADAVIEGKSMRKEEDLEKEKLEPIGEDETRERIRGRVQLEEEFEDEDLLGAATLQKLAESKRELGLDEEEVVSDIEEVVVEETEEVEEEVPVKAPHKKQPKSEEVSDAEEVVVEEAEEEVPVKAPRKKQPKSEEVSDVEEVVVEEAEKEAPVKAPRKKQPKSEEKASKPAPTKDED